MTDDHARCKAKVWKRDTYRLKHGHGFRMHYTRVQCARAPVAGDDLCWQHIRAWQAAGRRAMFENALEADPCPTR